MIEDDKKAEQTGADDATAAPTADDLSTDPADRWAADAPQTEEQTEGQSGAQSNVPSDDAEPAGELEGDPLDAAVAKDAERIASESTSVDESTAETATDGPDAELDSDGDTGVDAAVDAGSGTVVAAPAAKSGPGLVGYLALMLALGAAAVAGYIYYELIYKAPFASQYAPMETVERVQQLQRSDSEHTQIESDLGAQLTTLAEQLEQARQQQLEQQAAQLENLEALESTVDRVTRRVDGQQEQQSEALAATEEQLLTNLNEVANRAPPSRSEWKIAEVEYLLRIANHRVLMERDADGGLQLLQTADAILAELDDFGFHQVRSQLAEEILSLKRVGDVDAQGMYLRLEAVKGELDGLPLRVPERLRDRSQTTSEEDAGLLTRILDQFSPYFAYRSDLKTRIQPLLAPDEITYLELNLRLMLEQAQLASLRSQQEIFEQSLDNAADWIQDHLDTDDPAVAQLVTEIEDLRDSSVLRDLPDISGSLRSLLATERGTT
ncbi:MAG: uroporphyrinogen-III C-methyltransferase [Pseudomonadota bacterium]